MERTFLIFPVFSTLLLPFCELSILFFFIGKWHSRGLFSGKWKIKKAFCYIHLTNLLDSRFFHYKFPFSWSHLVWKSENLVTDLPPQLRLGWQNCHSILIFQTWRLLETENYNVKTFCSHQIGQIYITIYYFLSYENLTWPICVFKWL